MNDTVKAASASRDVLERCEYFLKELRSEPKGIAWAAKFSATMALLRSIGHVLHKTDSKIDKSFEASITHWWNNLKKTKPHPAIFWQFVDDERNLILKEGQPRAGQSVTIKLQAVAIVARAGSFGGEPAVAEASKPSPAPPETPELPIYNYNMNEGSPFVGRDPRELVAEAIAWWRIELEAIESRARWERAPALPARLGRPPA
jgi:hypothetical protein